MATVWMSAGCPTGTPTEPPVDPSPASDENYGPLEPEAAANKSEGERLELIIPAVEGGSIDLAELRGRPVVMVLAETTNPEWPRVVEFLEALQSQDARAAELVLVAADPDPQALDDLIVPWRLGWDPQGAMAARLSVARLPTVFVLDAEGTIVLVLRGFDGDDPAQVREKLLALGAAR